MPQDAFFKLDKEKREKIINAMEKEFGTNSFEKASITKIVEEAGISKGSFWFYFENKEDAIHYIVQNYLEREKQMAMQFLEKNHGDIFQMYTDMFETLMKEKPKDDRKELLPNICKNLMISRKNMFDKPVKPPKIEERLIEEKTFIEKLDKNSKEKYSIDEIMLLIKHLNYALRTNLVDYLTGVTDEEKAHEKFLKELKLLKGGEKKNA